VADNNADNLPQRRSIRLTNYNYTQAGAYYITICTEKRNPLFGHIRNGVMHHNACGRIVHDCWQAIPKHCPNVALDYFVVMPNHVHGILLLENSAGTMYRAPTAAANGDRQATTPHAPAAPRRFGNALAGSLAAMVGMYKAAVTRQINQSCRSPGGHLWQRNYWEHIIRDERELAEVRRYIAENPLRWSFDRENPEAAEPDDNLPWEPERRT
jgi:REP-associated tyrosine transposase